MIDIASSPPGAAGDGSHDERAHNEHPVGSIGPVSLEIPGRGCVPAFASPAWLAPNAAVRTALILVHGRLRNADAYYLFAEAALRAAGRTLADTVLVVPQFLAEADVAAFGLPGNTLYWDWISWMGGDAALGPSACSSFEVLDAVAAQLARPECFPQLERIVIAGHSGGAQVVQRYAVVARAEPALVARGIRVRYVVANPSSYLYFDTRRPTPAGTFEPFERAACPDADLWKYGLQSAPPYVDAASPDQLEAAYVRRDVVYLWGEQDCDPAHPALDRTCAAALQGPDRLARGQAYFRYLSERHGADLLHRGWVVPDAGHDGAAMLCSARGAMALFGDTK